MDEWNAIGERTLALAQRLVACPSVVDTPGEAACAELLHVYLREQLGEAPGVELRLVGVLKPAPCHAVLAFLPAARATGRTLVLLGHFDTVGLEPYGPLADRAFDSARLKEHFAAAAGQGSELAGHAASPDWTFGRGWLDMKGGVAAAVEVFLREARRRELTANLVLLLTPDEESQSRGVRALIPELIELKERHGLELARIINADYTAPLSPGDDHRYLYSGTVGKLLLGVSVFGRTTHVGETFHGLNASALAGYLAGELEHDRKLLQGAGGEWLPPPTVLHLGDRRERYDVMTLDYAELYVNLFHTGGRPVRLWDDLLSELRRLARRYDRALRLRYGRFSARTGLELPRFAERAEVIDYATLEKRAAKAAGAGLPQLLAGLRADAAAAHADERERALEIIRRLHGLLPPGRPLIVASLLPPFYPAQLAGKRTPATQAVEAFCARQELRHRRVYPYIADMSYFAFDTPGLEAYARQSPLWFGDDELAQYRKVAAPVLNLGPFGIGAHSAEERVCLSYLRQLPRLLSELLETLAGA